MYTFSCKKYTKMYTIYGLILSRVYKMKLKFRCEELELLYRDRNYRHRKMPYKIQKSYALKCDYLECAESLHDIYARTSFHFEKYKDHYSIRITQQWRIELDIDKV